MFDEEPKAAAPAVEPEPPANKVEFDLSMFDEEPKAAAPAVEPEPPANNVEFDLSSFGADEAATTAESEVEIDLSDFGTEESTNAGSLDAGLEEFDLSSFGADEAATTAESEVEFDLSDFGAEEAGSAESDEVVFDLPTFDAEEQNPSSHFDFQMGESHGSLSQETGLGDDLENMDVLETKLDLAKAYIDMGDLESAKGIAEKILVEGSDEQKLAAQELLEAIGLSK
jgi:pilus assembly protein FimV